MENTLASSTLAMVSYRIATDPNYMKELSTQLTAGTFDGGKEISAEEVAAMIMLLDPNQASKVPVQDNADGPMGTWIG